MKNITSTVMRIAWIIIALLITTIGNTQTVSDFENLTLSPNSFWDGSDLSGSFISGNVNFHNTYNTGWSIWDSGFAYSNMKDTTTSGYTNLYSARTAIGYSNSANYAVGQNYAKLHLLGAAAGKQINGFYATNSNYAYFSMKDGDSFAKKFGGVSGNDPDWFKLSITGYFNGAPIFDTVDFFLADFRFSDNAQDYILKDWQWVNLTTLGNVDSLVFLLNSSDTGTYGMNTPPFFCLDNFTTADSPVGIFPPSVGHVGTTAIYKDSTAILAWATYCHVTQGWQNIADTSLGKADVVDRSMAIGPAGTNGVVSLGDGGIADLTFLHPIQNGPSWDFAIFENSFSDTFLELAFVEVSSDGINYFRFPATSLTDTNIQVPSFGELDATRLNNLAGKYRGLYGTPFDLNELAGIPDLDINQITHVRIIDVVGSINKQYGTYDSFGHIINDPFPTPFNSSGFDLDAVAVLHQDLSSMNENSQSISFQIFPNPAFETLHIISTNEKILKASIININGSTVYETTPITNNCTIDVNQLSPAIYILKISTETATSYQKIIISKR